jgi:hypothetical protein
MRWTRRSVTSSRKRDPGRRPTSRCKGVDSGRTRCVTSPSGATGLGEATGQGLHEPGAESPGLHHTGEEDHPGGWQPQADDAHIRSQSGQEVASQLGDSREVPATHAQEHVPGEGLEEFDEASACRKPTGPCRKPTVDAHESHRHWRRFLP